MDQNKIGEFIAQCRKEHNMTQMQFAEKLGVTNKAVSKRETGKCLPDAALFDDICMLLNITLNELFAGERIAPENIEKKSEENLIGIATELQKKDHKIVLLKYFTAIIALVASATSISVGGISFEGTPVFSNLLLTILVICTWGALMYFTQKDRLEMSRNVQSGNTQNLKSTVIQRSFPKWSVAERRKTAAASDQAAVCACAHSRYFAGGSPSGLRV